MSDGQYQLAEDSALFHLRIGVGDVLERMDRVHDRTQASVGQAPGGEGREVGDQPRVDVLTNA